MLLGKVCSFSFYPLSKKWGGANGVDRPKTGLLRTGAVDSACVLPVQNQFVGGREWRRAARPGHA